MRLSIARVSAADGHTPGDTVNRDAVGFDVRGGAWRRMAVALAAALVLGCVGILFGSSKPAGADTPVFASGQVFASVGNSAVNVYSQGAGNPLVTRLNDGLQEPYTAGSAFDTSGNFYVTDDYSGDVSEYAPDGSPGGVFASGLQNPLSLAFDNQGNLYVGQQTTPYIAEFDKTGQLVQNIGPVATELTGDDWIALAPDECTFYYTTEETDILRYNMCTNHQESNFNLQPFASIDPSTGLPVQAFQLQILPDGDVLVADSNADILLDPNGNVLQTYTCASLPGCQGSLFAMSLDPDDTSFWTGDSTSGNVWEVDIATGAVQQQIDTHSGSLYGLSVDEQIEVAAPPPTTAATPSTLTVAPVTGNFSTPTPVSAVLTDQSTGAPIVDEPVTFTLNGSETCTANTDSTGTATCDITAGETSSSYTLTASFPGDTTTSTPLGSDSSTTSFTVNPDTSGLTYTGSTSAVNGQPTTLSGTLTTDNPVPGTPLPTKVVTLTIGSGSTAQSCSGTTDADGNVSCNVATVDQPGGTEPIDATFTGDSYDTPSSATSSLSVTEPTVLTVNPTTVTYGGSTTVSGTLTDSNLNQPVSNEPVNFTVNNTETCTGTTDSSGLASCTITPGESTGSYTVSGTFPGDTTQPVPLTTSTNSAAFVVTPAVTTLTYTGSNSTTNGQPLVVSGVLTTGSTPLANQPVTLTLGSGSSAQTCDATTDTTGAASCTIASVNQPVGPNPVSATYPGTNNYQPAGATSTVQVGPTSVSTTLTVTSTTGSYGSPTTVTGTLINNYTSAPVPGETVTLKLNGTQSCTGTTNASGVATCSITPSEPGGSYTLSGSFGGDTQTVPTLLPSTGSGPFVVTKAPTTVNYTGSTSITSGNSPVLSATLTSNGAPVAGQTVTFTVGTGNSTQRCSGTTNSAGKVSCGICMFNQSASPLPVTVSYGGNSYYSTSSTPVSVTVNTPTSLSVSAVTATTGQPTTVTGTLTNQVTGQGISGQTVTLTLDAAQSCTATTGSTGKASCSVTPNEPSGTYPVTGSFAGNTTSTQLLPSTGHNNFVVTPAATSVTYTGATTATNASSITLSSTLTSNGTPLSGQTVVMNLGTGKTAQSCTATTTSSGAASCSISSVNQVTGSVSVTVSYVGNGYYQSASTSSTVKIANSGGGGSSGGGGGGSGGGYSGGGGGGGSEPPPVGGRGGPCPGM
jgi:hypothetical protein